MSDHHATSAPTSGGFHPLETARALISPRQNAEAKTIVHHLAETSGKIWDLLKLSTATVIDVPLGVSEAVIAGVNNTIGSLTTGVDIALVQPINKVRSKIFETLNHPSKLLGA